MYLMFPIDHNRHLTIPQYSIMLFIVLLDPINKLLIFLLPVTRRSSQPLVIS